MTRQRTITRRRPSYSDAVRWIAQNDEPTEKDAEVVQGLISTLLVADLFGADPRLVAIDIVRCRAYRDNPAGGVPAMYRLGTEG